MNNLLPLFLFILVVFSSCNEKIAPALQNPTAPTTAAQVVSGAIRLKEKSPDMLGYVLHKANEPATSKCEINSTSIQSPGTSPTSPIQSIPEENDITCMLEAEESYLHWNGVEFELEVDKDICDKVVYTPYSFYQWQPGSSTRSMNYAECGVGADPALSGYPTYICNTYKDLALPNGTATDEEDLCVFDYSKLESGEDTGPNCDEGEIGISKISCTREELEGGGFDYSCTPPAFETKKCGGKRSNCVSGPIEEVRGDVAATRFNVFYDVQKKVFKQSWKIPAPREKKHETNLYIANFTRQCAGVEATQTPHDVIDFDMANHLGNASADPSSQAFLDYYARIYKAKDMFAYTRQGLQAYPGIRKGSDYNDLGLNTQIYADDPFRGSSAISPFYEFVCLDGASEVKARIRVAIRDWDRTFESSNPILQYTSDIFVNDYTNPSNDISTIARMDTGLRFLETEEYTYPHSEHFNDYWDWDDWFNPDNHPDATAYWLYNPFAVNNDGSCSGIDDQGLNSPLVGPKARINFPGFAL